MTRAADRFVTMARGCPSTHLKTYGPGQYIKPDHRAEVPKFGCSNLWMDTRGAEKARIWTRTGANFTVRRGDSEYEGPRVDFGPRDHKNSHFLFSDFNEWNFREPRKGKA